MKKIKQIKPKKFLNRKKKDPNQFVSTITDYSEDIDIQLFKYNKNDFSEKQSVVFNEIEKFASPDYLFWLNIYGIHEASTIASICQKLDIHNLVIQDILDVNQRPKFQVFDDYCFFTMKSIVPSSSELNTEQISFVFGSNYLVSFQERRADYFDHIRYRIRQKVGILRDRGVDYLLYLMLEAILDNYFKTLQHLEIETDNYQLDIKEEPSPEVLKRIEHHKKHIHIIRKTILPIKEFTFIVEREDTSFIEKRNLKYFLELKDLCLTLLDNCEMLNNSFESSTNLFFSIQGHRMNQVMKTLTIVATIFIPLTFVAGIYGMNFTNMPELQWKYGYLAIWIVIVIIFLAMTYYFKKKNWF